MSGKAPYTQAELQRAIASRMTAAADARRRPHAGLAQQVEQRFCKPTVILANSIGWVQNMPKHADEESMTYGVCVKGNGL